MKNKVNLKQLSEHTGFSIATISNALNHKKGVNAETASTIFRVARELGYISEDRITKIKFVIFRKNGLIVEDTPFFPLLINGVEKECRTLGFEIVLNHINQEDPDYIGQINWLIHDNSSALMILGTEMTDQDMKLFQSTSCPLLTLDFWCGDMSFNGVLINNNDSAVKAVTYLISKGHREIGYLRGSFRIKAFNARAQGFRSAMNSAKLPINTNYLVTLHTTMNGAYRDMLQHIDTGAKIPSAFFADNDMIALGAMRALQERGYRIPEDVSIIGFDDLPLSEMSTPPLTTIRVPKQEMGQLAVRYLAEIVRETSKVRTKTEVCTSFIERDSVLDLTKRQVGSPRQRTKATP